MARFQFSLLPTFDWAEIEQAHEDALADDMLFAHERALAEDLVRCALPMMAAAKARRIRRAK